MINLADWLVELLQGGAGHGFEREVVPVKYSSWKEGKNVIISRSSYQPVWQQGIMSRGSGIRKSESQIVLIILMMDDGWWMMMDDGWWIMDDGWWWWMMMDDDGWWRRRRRRRRTDGRTTVDGRRRRSIKVKVMSRAFAFIILPQSCLSFSK